jgi:hypothetical protein
MEFMADVLAALHFPRQNGRVAVLPQDVAVAVAVAIAGSSDLPVVSL